ncbi:hypothetical protein [Methylomusa anaerophila]|uniref:hypothetical protein n=1 Tax=Methylomusa anaerophila TaxID=1930071 RepID=UPI0013154CBF|nr:hypothetical protein [Methylomusa anaerophila]
MKPVPVQQPADRPAQPIYPAKPKSATSGFAEILQVAIEQYIPPNWSHGTSGRR